ncbi:hypothetical protein NTGZN8_10008 [Candidatus Nitrotoga fabula]|uniref:Uncharacterized protein n=1 Tax=Candidatus Nitrotoga fabula TaxID=2182327 RepID=A0A916BA91_9PROT|nr:hypothetical protein NTGZN8_10008 [Candidatus Nitrotoga fabula]
MDKPRKDWTITPSITLLGSIIWKAVYKEDLTDLQRPEMLCSSGYWPGIDF